MDLATASLKQLLSTQRYARVASPPSTAAISVAAPATSPVSLLRPLQAAQALVDFAHLISSLQAVHDCDILHLDLKPANVMLDSRHAISLIDFGIAGQMESDATCAFQPAAVGSANYMPPEAVFNAPGTALELHRRSDVWSAGAILFEMIFGRPPFKHMGTNLPWCLIQIGQRQAAIATAPETEAASMTAELGTEIHRLMQVPPDVLPLRGILGALYEICLACLSPYSVRPLPSDILRLIEEIVS
jgi:serine/threonine protein kinase